MIKIFTIVSLLLVYLQLTSQTLVTQLEYVNSDITWPWNWDVISDQDKLITVNEIGTLNIRSNGIWQNIEVNPNTSSLEPRGVAVDNNGTIWMTTTEHGLWSYDGNGDLQQFDTSNSFLPVDKLRSIAIYNNIFWISTDGLGLIRHDFDTNETTHFTKDEYPDLKSDFNLDPHIDESGNVWFSNREFLTKISTNLEWTNEDMRFHISGGNVKDIHIVSETEIWLAMNGGLVLFDGTNYNKIIQSQFDNFLQVLKDSRGDIWLSRSSTLNGNGITVVHNEEEYFFNSDDNSAIPNQVFEFIEHQDTVIAVGTIGNNICKLVFNSPSSITDIHKDALKVYPNPVYDELTVEIMGDLNVSNWILSDLQGKKVIEGSSLQSTIDVKHISSGVYILTLEIDNELISRKVTIDK